MRLSRGLWFVSLGAWANAKDKMEWHAAPTQKFHPKFSNSKASVVESTSAAGTADAATSAAANSIGGVCAKQCRSVTAKCNKGCVFTEDVTDSDGVTTQTSHNMQVCEQACKFAEETCMWHTKLGGYPSLWVRTPVDPDSFDLSKLGADLVETKTSAKWGDNSENVEWGQGAPGGCGVVHLCDAIDEYFQEVCDRMGLDYAKDKRKFNNEAYCHTMKQNYVAYVCENVREEIFAGRDAPPRRGVLAEKLQAAAARRPDDAKADFKQLMNEIATLKSAQEAHSAEATHEVHIRQKMARMNHVDEATVMRNERQDKALFNKRKEVRRQNHKRFYGNGEGN